MGLLNELKYRNLIYQTTFKDLKVLDKDKFIFYLGVDPSADSMTIGNLAVIILVKHFINYGHKAFLLVGGATGQIGDPDGKSKERELTDLNVIKERTNKLSDQFKKLLDTREITVVNNNDWIKDLKYIDFLREIGKYVPLRQMVGRDFVQSRISSEGNGISYAEFSYSLIQGYDFYYLFQKYGVNLQLCGADQWGNSITGVDLIRRKLNNEVNVLSLPLIINKATGVKFGKTEDGAIWLDPNKTTPTAFYQFFINTDDQSLEDFLKIYTFLSKEQIDEILIKHRHNPSLRIGQSKLAFEVTKFVHGLKMAQTAQNITEYLTVQRDIKDITSSELELLKKEVKHFKVSKDDSILKCLVEVGLAASKGEARRLLNSNAITLNNIKTNKEELDLTLFHNNLAILRRGKAFKDSALLYF